mgnify:FL=1
MMAIPTAMKLFISLGQRRMTEEIDWKHELLDSSVFNFRLKERKFFNYLFVSNSFKIQI